MLDLPIDLKTFAWRTFCSALYWNVFTCYLNSSIKPGRRVEQNKLSKTGSMNHFCSQRNRLDQDSRKDYLAKCLGNEKLLGKAQLLSPHHIASSPLSLPSAPHSPWQPLSCWSYSSFCKCTQRFILMSTWYSSKMLVIKKKEKPGLTLGWKSWNWLNSKI